MKVHGVNWDRVACLEDTSGVGGSDITESSDRDLLVSLLAYGGVADFFSTLETSLSSLLLIRVVTGLHGTSRFFLILFLLLLGLVLLL